LDITEIAEKLAQIGPLLTQIGIPGLLAGWLYIEIKERKRLQAVLEVMTDRVTKGLMDANHGMAGTRDSMNKIHTVITGLRDLLLILAGRAPTFTPPTDNDPDNNGGQGS